ncbi:MAG: HD domain-containing protein, partial [Myxococcota bacterium]
LDVDRLDYLVRDATFSGARYGQVDVDWLISHLVAQPVDGRVTLGLDARALYAFDDFLISRHHMFLMVYFHHKSVVYEEILRRHVIDPGCDWALSADLDEYLRQDDLDLWSHLRRSQGPWARRIVQRRPYKRVLEVHGSPAQVDLSREHAVLTDAGIDGFLTSSTGRLSRYEVYGQKRRKAPRILVVERVPSVPRRQFNLPGLRAEPDVQVLADATAVFERYADARRVARLFVSPEDVGRAEAVLGVQAG